MRVWAFVLWACIGIIASPAEAADDRLRFVDDQGRPLARAIEVCFQVDLKNECATVEPGGAARLPASFQRLRAEGADHGPVSLRREDLVPGQPVKLPRKALLRVTGPLDPPPTLSLYDPRDASFRTPAFRAPVPASGSLKVPAGDSIASFSAPAQAPHLLRLSVKPGATARVRYAPQPGWSLLLRCREALAGRNLAQTQVALEAAEGYGSSGTPPEATTGDDGLALLSGVPATLATALVRRAGFLPQEVRGLSASPGTFAFREVELERGGRVRARVRLDGKPVVDVACRLLDYAAQPAAAGRISRELFRGRTDGSGLCESAPLPAGSYSLWIEPPGSGSRVERPAEVREAETTEIELSLSPIRVSGKVRRGDRALPGYTVEAVDVEGVARKSPADPPTAQATSGEDGSYEVTLWSPGEYEIFLQSPTGSPAAGSRHRRTLAEGDEETLDFDLVSVSLQGRVIDDGQKPVEGASVVLRWNNQSLLLAHSGAQGEFEFPAEEEGHAEIRAAKSGYLPGEPQQVTVSAEAPPPAVVLTLRRGDFVGGTLLAPSGAPLPGASVALAPARAGDAAVPVRFGTTDAQGRFELERPGAGPVRLFASGPGCPLSSFEPAQPDEVLLRCSALPAGLELTFQDEEGRPVPHAGVLLRLEGVPIPTAVLAHHLASFGAAAESDGAGRLILPALAAGPVDLFLAGASSEGSIEAGSTSGFLNSTRLTPLSLVELEVTP